MEEEDNAPGVDKDVFRCPHCNAVSRHEWSRIFSNITDMKRVGSEDIEGPKGVRSGYRCLHEEVEGIKISYCHNCEKCTLWVDEEIIYPVRGGPNPNSDMPASVKDIYNEARNVKNISPKSAAALLRLALEKLLVELEIGDENDSLHYRIGHLIEEKDISDQTEKGLDIVRNVGSDAVHLGLIYLGDTEEAAERLFYLINRIVEEVITIPKETEEMFDDIPENKKKGIRDRKKEIEKKD